MALPINNVGYGITNALQGLAPEPIISTRNPGVRDHYELGTIWCNKSANTYFILNHFYIL